MEIVLTTRSSAIHGVARSIAISMLRRLRARDDTEDVLRRDFEAAWWVDCISATTLDEFCTVLQKTVELALPVVVAVAHAWRKAGLPNPIPDDHASPILVCALQQLPKASEQFAALIRDDLPKWAKIVKDSGATVD